MLAAVLRAVGYEEGHVSRILARSKVVAVGHGICCAELAMSINEPGKFWGKLPPGTTGEDDDEVEGKNESRSPGANLRQKPCPNASMGLCT